SSELRPLGFAACAEDRALDEAHAARAVEHRRVVTAGVATGLAPLDGVGYRSVDVGEGLEERLGVTRRQTSGALRGLAQVPVATPQQFDRAVERRVPQLVGFLLSPSERGLLPVYLQHQVVLVPDLDLRCDHHALGATLEAQQQVAVVVETAAGNEGGEVGDRKST